MAKYVVTAPRVVLTTMTMDGVRAIGLFAGAPVPDDVPPEQIRHHLDNNLIAEVPEPAPPARPAPAKAEGDKPAGKPAAAPGKQG
jgi:hypothetical protein